MLLLASTVFAEVKSTETEAISQAELESYYNSLREQIQKQDATVQRLVKRAQSGQQVPMPVQKQELEHAVVMLDVKRTLYSNFYETESLKRSPAIRKLLLKILSQPDVSIADLAELQNLVRVEKARLGIMN